MLFGVIPSGIIGELANFFFHSISKHLEISERTIKLSQRQTRVLLQKLQDSSLVARIPQLRYVRFNKGYSFIPVSQNNFIKSSFSMNYDVRFIHSL